MRLGEKFRQLREVEGDLRGLGRAMTQQELLKAIQQETGQSISQGYLSQIESGKRPHLTNKTRLLLAHFFKVHPGFLVDDPEGYHPELVSEARALEDKLDVWLASGADRFQHDPALSSALVAIAKHPESCKSLILLAQVLQTPGLAERLTKALSHAPQAGEDATPSHFQEEQQSHVASRNQHER